MIDDPIGSNLSDEEIAAIKGQRGGGRWLPPGGGGPGPGPGGGFGGSGSGFFGSGVGAVGVEGFGGWPKRKLVRGPNGDISVSLSPLTSDNVPIMASAGETVMNNGVTQMIPGAKEQLDALNRQGAQLLALGGHIAPVAGGSPAYEAGRQMGMMMRQGRQAMACGGEVKPQGYAFGGVVRQQGGYQRTPQMPLGAPRMPVQPQTTVGATPRPGAAPMAPPAPNVGPGPVNSGMGPNPWQEAPISPGSPNPGDEWMNRISALLRDWGRQGAFDMNGNPALMAALRSEATTNADALRRRAALNADALGLDAGQRGSYAMQSDLNTQGGVANTLNDAVLKQLLGQQSFGQGLLGKMYDANTQAWLAQLTKWMGQK